MFDRVNSLDKRGREVMVRITEINTNNKIIWAEGAGGSIYQISFAGLPPFVAIPQADERWIITAYNSDWRLERRIEDGTESIGVSNLGPGDRRIDTRGKVYVSGKEVNINAPIKLSEQSEPDVPIDGLILFCRDKKLFLKSQDGVFEVSLTPINQS